MRESDDDDEEEEEGWLPPPKIKTKLKSENSDVCSYVTFKNLGDEVVQLFWINFVGELVSYGSVTPMERGDIGKGMNTFVTHPWIVVTKQNTRWLLNGELIFQPPNPESWLGRDNGSLHSKWNRRSIKDHNSRHGGESGQDEVNNEGDDWSNEGDNSDGCCGCFGFGGRSDRNVTNDEEDDSGDDPDGDEDENEANEFVNQFRDLSLRKYYEVLIYPPICMALRKQALIRCCELFSSDEDVKHLDIPSTLKKDIASTRKKYFVQYK